MKALVFRGDRKAGKTCLVERAVRELRARGYRVGTIKHCPHLHPEKEQNDSGRMLRAGAGSVILLTAGVEVRYRHIPDENDLMNGEASDGRSRLQSVLQELDQDYVLVEGFKSYPGPLPSLLISRTPTRLGQLITPSTIACSGPVSLEKDARRLGLTYIPPDVPGKIIADFIEGSAAAVQE